MSAEKELLPTEIASNTRMSKVSRYGWVQINAPGRMCWLDKSSLRVDHSYQRAMNEHKRRRMASEWNWVALGALIVAEREDGSLWVIDGQHRLGAAMSRSDVRDLPCLVFPMSRHVQDEAKDFLLANKERRPLTGVETFRATVLAGDPLAAELARLVQESGRAVSNGGSSGANTFKCPVAAIKHMRADIEAFRRAWPLVMALSEGRPVDNRLLAGVCEAERRAVDSEGRAVSIALTKHLRERLLQAGFDEVMRAIARSASFYQRGGETVFARGVMAVLNKRARHILSLRGDSEVNQAATT